MKKRKNKIKTLIFKALAYIFGFMCILSICALDSEPFWIPLCGVAVFGLLGWFTFCLWLIAEDSEGGEW